jgi:hypothetical protein
MKNKYRIYDTFNRRVVSNHLSLRAAVIAAAKFSRAVKRNNGENSYIPTRIEQPDTDGDWLPVPIDEVHDAEYTAAVR